MPPPPSSPFETLYTRHVDAVYVWALRYAKGNTAWAEDLVHEVFLQALKHHAQLREDDVRGWLYRVTQSLAFRQLRRERFLEASLALIGGLFSRKADHDSPETQLQRKRDAASATAALDRLPGQERVVLSAKVLDGKSQREIAQLLGLSEGYVSKLLARAFHRLQAEGWELPREP